MKKKIISLLLCTTLVVGACGKYSHAHEERVTPKSAVAISGATATAILTLATYSGIQFHDSETFDEFLRRMCGLEQFADFSVQVLAMCKASVDGVVNFTESMVNDFKEMVNRITVNKEINYTKIGNYSLPVIDGGISDQKASTLVRNLPAKHYASNITGASTGVYTYNLGDFKFTVSAKTSSGDEPLHYTMTCNSDTSNWGSTCMLNYTDYGDSYGVIIGYPVVFKISNTEYRIGYVGTSGYSSYSSYGTSYYCRKHTIGGASKLNEKSLNMTTDSSWSTGKGTVESNDSNGGVSVSLPSSMGSLLDKSPSDVSNPTYDVWTPGTDVSIPDIDNPAIEYTPDKSTDSPGDTDTDNPGDTGTQNPGLPDFGPITVPNIDLTPLQLSISSITEKFPFSLPWDIKRIGETFKGNSSVNAPVIEFEFNNHNVKLDFNRFNSIAMIIRGFVYVEFAIGLIYVIRKLKP